MSIGFRRNRNVLGTVAFFGNSVRPIVLRPSPTQLEAVLLSCCAEGLIPRHICTDLSGIQTLASDSPTEFRHGYNLRRR
ncbi:hypothetical protein M407DRAFT_204505 [Tulasnella calospora MUT 4182]|uniref:Uncharacterized protein n=1 Tax=Tulasnella calospora MUT 4182 TaxID=1051891 RepID=A0A0C3QKL2_9AGAM|nr:hypothetical protein M407DRAFT_204505 [Tulasnella calospora MUT 4182]